MQFQGSYSDLPAFVETHRLPLVVRFTQESAPSIFGRKIRTHFITFCDHDADTEIVDALTEAAKAFRGELIFVTVGHTSNRLVEFFGIAQEDFPTARLVVMGEGSLKKYNFGSSDFSLAAITGFVHRFQAGEVEPDLKSEEPPASNSEPVKVVVGKTFNDIVLSDKDVFVEFYAPWCGT